MMQVPKSKLDWKHESSPLSHYFRSKRRNPTRLEKHGAAQSAGTYALSLRALNFVTTMAESQVYTNFQLVSRRSLCPSGTFCNAPTLKTELTRFLECSPAGNTCPLIQSYPSSASTLVRLYTDLTVMQHHFANLPWADHVRLRRQLTWSVEWSPAGNNCPVI